jgi:hypothetical protein
MKEEKKDWQGRSQKKIEDNYLIAVWSISALSACILALVIYNICIKII